VSETPEKVDRSTKPADELARWRTIGLIASVVIVLTIPIYAVKESYYGLERDTSEGDRVTFVGREKCISCHQAAYQAWLGSDHDNSMAKADETMVRGDFGDALFEHRGVTSRFYRKDGKYYVHTQGPGGEMGDFEVAYTFGIEPLQQYLIPFPGGRLQCLSIAWDTERGEWFHLYPDQDIPPDDWLHWTRNAQNWNGMCAECHSTNLEKGYDPESRNFSTTWSEIDVSCEACHGPGSRHVDWAEIPPMARPDSENYELVIRTGDITSRQQVELCAPCHSRRTELGDYDHTRIDLLDNLVPSVLEEPLYYADGQIRDEVYVYGSFVQSKMFANDVRCSDCHDVHSLKLVKEGNDLCLQCHRGDAYDSYEHHFHQKVYEGKPSDGALCVKCHMPERPYMIVDYRADHSIRVPRPDLTRDIGTPNACSQGGCHDDRPLQWLIDYYERWYGRARKPHYGTIIAAGRARKPEARDQLARLAGDSLYPAIVRATALSLLGAYPGEESTRTFNLALADEEALVRYTAVDHADALGLSAERLVEIVSPLLFDPVRAVRMLAATKLAGIPDEMFEPYQREALAESLDEYKKTMEYSLDFSFSGLNLGNLYSRLGDPEKAEKYYKTAIEIDDLFYPAKVNLAILYNSMGRNEEAEELLRSVLDAYPEMYDAAYSLGLLMAEMGRLPEAVGYLGRASQGMPERSRAHYNLGLALQTLERYSEAEAAFQKALAVEPDNLDYLYALADHYMKRNELRKALAVVERMIAAHPDNPLGPDLKANIERVLGSIPNR
jgi:predicted CXXCH cytochrome family protein